MALAAVAAGLMGAASPRPDLSAYLAPAPGSDWVERPANPSDCIGPFTAQNYSTLVGDNGVSERALGRYAFVAGYGRNWLQRRSQDYLVERVFEFDSDQGSISWFNDLRISNETMKDYKRDIVALDTLGVLSFGVELDYAGGREYRVEFVKGDLFFVVHMGSATNDLSVATHDQAMTLYEMAPDVSAHHVAGVRAGSVSLLLVGGIFASVILIVAFVSVIVVVALAQLRRPRPQAPGANIRMSPDGAYWWDGYRWRHTATDPPARTS